MKIKKIIKCLMFLMLFCVCFNTINASSIPNSGINITGSFEGSIPENSNSNSNSDSTTGNTYTCQTNYCTRGYAGTRISLVSINEVSGALELLREIYYVNGNAKAILNIVGKSDWIDYRGNERYRFLRLGAQYRDQWTRLFKLTSTYNENGRDYILGTINGLNYDYRAKEIDDNLFYEANWNESPGSTNPNFPYIVDCCNYLYPYAAWKVKLYFLDNNSGLTNTIKTIKEIIDQNISGPIIISNYPNINIANINFNSKNHSSEEINAINSLALVFEPFYAYYHPSTKQYIIGTVKALAKIAYDDCINKNNCNSFPATAIETIALTAYVNVSGKYGIINKEGFIKLDGISNTTERYEYIANPESGYGYNIIRLNEIPGYEERINPIKCDLSVTSDMPSDCKVSTQGSVTEPTICSLVLSGNGKEELEKNGYNIKNFYTETITKDGKTHPKALFATTYCQNTATYNFYGLKDAISGRYFTYDINKDETKYFATIKGKVKCFSDINYDLWNKAYDIANRSVKEKLQQRLNEANFFNYNSTNYEEFIKNMFFDNENITYNNNAKMSDLLSIKSDYKINATNIKYSYSDNNIESLCGKITEENKKTICGKNPSLNVSEKQAKKYKYVSVDVEYEKNYYQASSIYTKTYSGDLSNEKENDSWLELEKRIFPVEFKSKNFEYNINLTYNLNLNMDSLNNINTYTCKVNVNYDDDSSTPPGPGFTYLSRLIYRSVDLLDLFPNSDKSSPNYRKPGSNWWDETNDSFIKLKNDIEKMERSESVFQKEPQYTVVLTLEKVKEIKMYNSNRLYSNNNLKCDLTGDNQLLCKSEFFDKFQFGYHPNIRNIFSKDQYNNYYHYQGKVN